MLRRILSIAENLSGALLVATTAVAWSVILEARFLMHHLHEQFVLMLIIWAGAFAVIETWEAGVERPCARRRKRKAIEQQVLEAAAGAESRLNYHDAARVTSLLLDEADRFMRDLAERGHCVLSDDEADTYVFPSPNVRRGKLELGQSKQDERTHLQ